MKASELRIGNLVNVDNPIFSDLKDIPLKIIGIKLRDEPLFPNSNSVISFTDPKNFWEISQFNEFIKPIQLTEEWKFKFGFEKTEWDNFNSHRLSVGDNDYAIVLYSDGNCEVGDIITCKIEYVHQLQNLYFSLVAEELTFKK